ncbi:MAG: 2-keto-3-deoxy-L-rhamnonate aldolase [Pseudorhodobacter sp. PARRP1]|nr:MAG: 2-keto-3-deoxy-L-rhamnonate aldolase [Pseudorhodobacter sp. PARRP1]
MPAPINPFKAALAAGKPQIGLWLGLANPITADLCANAGFDWLLIDGEHAPNDIPTILAQAQAIGDRSHVIVRPPLGEVHRIKQILDLGVQTVLVPMIETEAQAAEMARAMLYPPQGVRGVGAALARASNFGTTPAYLATANAQTCLLLQIESRAGLAQLDAIAATPGVDGVFIGPADLAADMGYLGNPAAAEVQAAVEAALKRTMSHGKAAGILTSDRALAQRYLDLGARFVAVGSDVGLLSGASAGLRGAFGGLTEKAAITGY